jgi:hypothetical protein
LTRHPGRRFALPRAENSHPCGVKTACYRARFPRASYHQPGFRGRLRTARCERFALVRSNPTFGKEEGSMRPSLAIALVAGCLGAGLTVARPKDSPANDLAPPFAVAVDGATLDKPTDATTTHGDNSYPFVGDFDGDGKFDLLVGQGRRGKTSGGSLRIYRNVGERGKPRFAEPIWFDDQTPTGRIPAG